ncbi:hypothetical protein CH375_16195, partial [Leptospira ellisii]
MKSRCGDRNESEESKTKARVAGFCRFRAVGRFSVDVSSFTTVRRTDYCLIFLISFKSALLKTVIWM